MASEERPIFLSTMPAGRAERRMALIAVLASLAVFAAAAPFARERLAPVWAFLPVYQSALVAVAHSLSFPGLFSETGLLGSGPQTTAWLYFLWHAVFPLLVIVYAMLDAQPSHWRRPGAAVLATLTS